MSTRCFYCSIIASPVGTGVFVYFVIWSLYVICFYKPISIDFYF